MLEDENADINEKVVTLQDLYEKRKILLAKRNKIINNQEKQKLVQFPSPPIKEAEKISHDDIVTSELDTLSIVYGQELIASKENNNPNNIDVNDDTVQQKNNGDFSSDDSVADPSFVPLSEITDLQPLSPDNTEWFPERDMEERDKNKNQRKRKGNPNNWQRQKNKRQRMLGKEYVGFKKIGSKYVQNESKPARMMGPLCMSKRCFSGKSMYCAKLTEDVRKNIAGIITTD